MFIHFILIVLDLIIIALQILLIRSLKSHDKFNNFVMDSFWKMVVDIGILKRRLSEVENELSI